MAGRDEAKESLQEVVDFPAQPDEIYCDRSKAPKGEPAGGPPGTGKTLLAKAVAGEAHVPVVATIVSRWNGSIIADASFRSAAAASP